MKFLISTTIALLFISLTSFAQDDVICKDFSDLVADEAHHHTQQFLGTKNTLTEDYDLKYHHLVWNVDPNERYILGFITSHFVPLTNDFKYIHFDMSEELMVGSVFYHGKSIDHEQLAGDVLRIELPEVVPQGQLDSLEIFYEGEPPSTGFGSFEQEMVDGNPVLWTLSEPYGAKDWWPCKQDLNDKIDSIDVVVFTPLEYRVASNGVLWGEAELEDQNVYFWKHRYPIPAYLIAIAVTNFEVYSNMVPVPGHPDIEVLNYVFPGDLELAMAKTEKIVDIMQLFNNLVGLYPFADEKYGHAQFGRSGGMEHQTMSFMGNFASDLQAHELAHQWFGDKVTCGSWEDIWLNEGFATYLTGLRKEFLDTEEHWYGWKSEAIAKVCEEPDGSVWVNDTTDVSRIFSQRLSYRKGALLLHMLRWQLGNDVFFQGVKNYLNDPALAYNYARTDDLKYHLETVSQQDLTEFFDDWFYNQGYPSYHINWSATASGIEITVDQNTSHASVDFFEMPIPMLVSGAGLDTLLRLDHSQSGQVFTIDLPFIPTALEFDPELWLITRGNSINGVSGTISPITAESMIAISPNPFTHFINIKSKEGEYIEQLEIIDASGRQLYESNSAKTDISLDTGDWPSALYFIKLQLSGQWYTGKVIKQ